MMNNTDNKFNSYAAFDSPLKSCYPTQGAQGRQEDKSMLKNNNYAAALPPMASASDGDHDVTTNLDLSCIQLNPSEFLQSSCYDRKIALLEMFSVFCLLMTKGWITVSEAEAFYRRMEYLLTKGMSPMQMENVVQRNKDVLEKFKERQTIGNLSTDLQQLEASMGTEVMKNFYFFRSFVVNLLSSDEHVRKISYLNSMFECLKITKQVQRQFQGGVGEQNEENKPTENSMMFHLSECIRRIEGKKNESVDLALNKAKLCVQAKDVRHKSYQSLSDQEQMEARRSCELQNETLSNLTFSALWMHRCWPQMKQYFVGSHQIKHNKLLDLREGYMIGNEVVDAYFALLSCQCKSSDFFIGDLHQLSKNYSVDDIELKATFNILKKKKLLMFPNHVDEVHFHLVLITMKDNWSFALDIFDSIRVTQRAHKERYYAPVLEFISKIMLAGGINDFNIEEKSFPYLSEQQNGCDCGIFMCMIAASLTGMIDEQWFNIDQNYITSKNCRASICASLITGQIQKPLP
jgi:hypothetical protein